MNEINENQQEFFFKCPICGSVLQVEKSKQGIKSECPVCHGAITPVQQNTDGIKVAQSSNIINGFDLTNDITKSGIGKYGMDDLPQYINTPLGVSYAKRWVYILFGLLFGVFGVHDMYARRFEHALSILIVSVMCYCIYERLLYAVMCFVIYQLLTVKTDGEGRNMQ